MKRCLSESALWQWVSIREEMGWKDRVRAKWHLHRCSPCQVRAEKLDEKWSAVVTPEPDVTASLLRVYSKLQSDETLVLRGWKLGETRREPSAWNVFWSEGWLFRTGLAGSALVLALVWSRAGTGPAPVAEKPPVAATSLARIRYEEPNRVRVRYVRPELMRTMEFETVGRSE